MAAEAVLIIPPLVKTRGQPMLGVSMLAGAGAAAGHTVHVLDLNREYLDHHVPGPAPLPRPPFLGDHDRDSALVRPVQEYTGELLRAAATDTGTELDDPEVGLRMRMDHEAAVAAADRLLATAELQPLLRRVEQHVEAHGVPHVFGVSVLFSGQVLFALALSRFLRRRYPEVAIVWGGPHVTALQPEISADARYAAGCIDGFVFGYAEGTWVGLLDALAAGGRWPDRVYPAGFGSTERAHDAPQATPHFAELDAYRWGRLTLPIQLSRGCAFGKCAHCTYPAVEGRYRTIDLTVLDAALAVAIEQDAVLAFKDALVTPARLEAIADRVQGRVHWAACTKLHARLDADLLTRLYAGGCRTLEVGLETLTDDGQLLLDKRQPLHLLLGFLDAAEQAGIAVVVNYMLGLPGADRLEERAGLARLRWELLRRSRLAAKVELNHLEVERRSALGRAPERYGLQVVREWPWASVVAVEQQAAR